MDLEDSCKHDLPLKLCALCLTAEIERLKAENEQLKANQELWGSIELITAQRKEKEQLRKALEGVSGNLVPGYGLCWCFADRRDTPQTIHESICNAATEALKSNEGGNQNAS